MMDQLKHFLVFYMTGFVVIGTATATMKQVTAIWRGKPLPCQRLVVGVVSGAVWSYTVFKLILGYRDHD